MKILDGVPVYGDDGVARTGTFHSGVGYLPLSSPEPERQPQTNQN